MCSAIGSGLLGIVKMNVGSGPRGVYGRVSDSAVGGESLIELLLAQPLRLLERLLLGLELLIAMLLVGLEGEAALHLDHIGVGLLLWLRVRCRLVLLLDLLFELIL